MTALQTVSLGDLRHQRATIVRQARALHEAAEVNKRDLSAEEEVQFNRLMGEAGRLCKRIDDEDRAIVNRAIDVLTDGPFVSRSFQRIDLSKREWANLADTMQPEYRKQFVNWLGGSFNRALQVDESTAGGYLVAPIQVMDLLIKGLDDAVYIRQWAMVFAVPSAHSLGIPKLYDDLSDPDWTTELGSGDEDQQLSFGRRDLFPHPLAKRIRVSNTLLNRAPNVEDIITDRFTVRFGTTMENNFLNGDGSQKPLGVFVASDDGIPTSRDVSTHNTTTAITMDNLVTVKYSLKPAYLRRARWLFHPDATLQIALLKDGEGQYLWRESIRAGEPDKLLGLPVYMSDYAPNTFTTGEYVGILGDFTYYWIADALDMTIQRLSELYAIQNQTGFLGRMESDGMPVVAEAFARVQLA